MNPDSLGKKPESLYRDFPHTRNIVTAHPVMFIAVVDANPAVQAVLSMPMLSPTAHVGRPATEVLAQKLVQDGAIMTLPGRPDGQALIGDLRWSDGAVCWFTAFGDSPRDAHRIDFTEAHAVQWHGIYFLNGRVATGYLSTIEAAGVQDPDDYRVAWQLWQQVAPLRTKLIEDCYSQLPP